MRQNLFLWGSNKGPKSWGIDVMPKEPDFGQLGLGIPLKYEMQTLFSPSINPYLIGQEPVSVVCGGFHTLVLCRNGKLYSFGSNAFGQLGAGDRKSRTVPTLVACDNVDRIFTGYAFSALITKNGELMTWGFNKNGRTGHSDDVCKWTEETKHGYVDVPTIVEQFKEIKVVNVACGSGHMLVLDDQGIVYSFGRNDLGQCGTFDEERDVRPNDFIVNLPHRKDEFKKRIIAIPNKALKIACCSYRSTIYDEKDQIWLFGNIFNQYIQFEPYHLHIQQEMKIDTITGGGFFLWCSTSGAHFADEHGISSSLLENHLHLVKPKSFSAGSSWYLFITEEGVCYTVITDPKEGDHFAKTSSPLDIGVEMEWELGHCGTGHTALIGRVKLRDFL